MAMMEIRNVHKTFRTYAKVGLRPGAHKVVSELPVLQRAIGTVALAPWQWMQCFLLALVLPVAVELVKWVRRRVSAPPQ